MSESNNVSVCVLGANCDDVDTLVARFANEPNINWHESTWILVRDTTAYLSKEDRARVRTVVARRQNLPPSPPLHNVRRVLDEKYFGAGGGYSRDQYDWPAKGDWSGDRRTITGRVLAWVLQLIALLGLTKDQACKMRCVIMCVICEFLVS